MICMALRWGGGEVGVDWHCSGVIGGSGSLGGGALGHALNLSSRS
jgi:hypothetical protein